MMYIGNEENMQIREKIREILGLGSAEDFSILLWRPVETPPEEESYVLVKLRGLLDDPNEIMCIDAAYEKETFCDFSPGSAGEPIKKDGILGWSYYPYDDRETR